MKNKSPKFKFKLGSEAKDTITDFSGIVFSCTHWLNGCNTYGLAPTELKDGVPQERQHFDEPQLELVKKDVHKSNPHTGGDAKAVMQTNR